ncbi:MAG: PilT/PilU family type 4a pilus ATPase [Actinomycetota bacterium]
MVATSSRQLAELLVERRVLSRDQMVTALAQEQQEGTPLSALLLQSGMVAEKDLIAAVAQQVGVPFADLATQAPRPDLLGVVPADLAQQLKVVPLDLDGDVLIVAMEDPRDDEGLKMLKGATGYTIKAALAERGELLRTLAEIHGGDTEQIRAVSELHLDELLIEMVDKGGSDLHLTAGMPPAIRLDGEIMRLDHHPVLNGSEIRRMMYEVLTQKQRERFEEHLELDTSHSIPDKGRFRVNMFVQRDSVGSVMRAIPSEIIPLEKLQLPDAVLQFAELPRGLVLVTGPTGSGKSTTLASLLDVINNSQTRHIMTVEDPIEFVHRHKRCVVNQREVGEDTHSFGSALKHVLRQDPDVILLGEMRDLETISTALTAAETGHLVFATLHTQDAPQSIDRMIDVFPPEQQQQVRVQLAVTLQGVITQTLLKSRDGRGRVAAVEILVAIPAVQNLIREGKAHQIYSTMQAGAKHGMQTMDQSLANLVKAGRIEMSAALEKCADEQNLKTLIGR